MIDVTHDGHHRRTGNGLGGGAFLAGSRVADIFLSLLFESDDVGVCAEEASHFAGEFGIERLVDGGEYSSTQQAGDQVFRADLKLLSEILHADTFCDRDAARNGRRLVRHHHARRWNVALHRTFLHAARDISLPWPSRRPSRTRSGASRTWRRCGRSNTDGTSSGRRLPSGMHRATFSGT